MLFKVRDWLYISDFATATSATIVKDAGIQAMLQLFQAFEMAGIETLYLDVPDGLSLRRDLIERGIAFIQEQQAKKHRLLITCGAGISRSVMFAIIALREIEGVSLKEAYYQIYGGHPKAMPDHIHWQAVAQYYDEVSDFWAIWGDITLRDED